MYTWSKLVATVMVLYGPLNVIVVAVRPGLVEVGVLGDLYHNDVHQDGLLGVRPKRGLVCCMAHHSSCVYAPAVLMVMSLDRITRWYHTLIWWTHGGVVAKRRRQCNFFVLPLSALLSTFSTSSAKPMLSISLALLRTTTLCTPHTGLQS